jgi:hypothetical protein
MSTEKLRCALEAEEKLRHYLEEIKRVLAARPDYQPAEGLVLKCYGQGQAHKRAEARDQKGRLQDYNAAIELEAAIPVTWETLHLLLERGMQEMQKVIREELERYHRRGGEQCPPTIRRG